MNSCLSWTKYIVQRTFIQSLFLNNEIPPYRLSYKDMVKEDHLVNLFMCSEVVFTGHIHGLNHVEI